MWIHGTQGTYRTSIFGDWVHAKSSMGPKQWLEVVPFCGKSPCRKGDSVATFGIHSHPSDCNFRLLQFVGINGTNGTHLIPQSDSGGHIACSVGPYLTVSGEGHFWSEIPMSEGGSVGDCLPPMSPKWLELLVGMVHMDS